MNNLQSNSDQLHEAGIINKEEMTQESIKAIDSLSQEEVGHLKVSSQSTKNVTRTAGIGL